MQGRIWVESETGQGSTFHFEARFGVSAARSNQPDTTMEQLHNMPVLIVDDNATNRRILREMVQRWGMRPTLAESGMEALSFMEQAQQDNHPFPLVITDRHMPGMDGFMLLERICANKAYPATILMLTSGDRPDDSARYRALHVTGYAIKPVSQAELLSLILKALGHASAPALRVSGPLAAPAEPGQQHLRILLAEDNVFNQRVALGMLTKLGHEVTVAKDGREAIEAYTRGPYDLVLMDIQMPEMDGFAATAEIRAYQQRSGVRAPIIAMTAHAMQGDREKCMAGGMDDYISKPIGRRDLAEIIARNGPSSTAEPGALDEVPEITGAQESTGQKRASKQLSSPHAETPLIDPEKMLARCGGDQEMVLSLAQMFPGESIKVLQNIERARNQKNMIDVEMHAHALRGMCGMFEALQAAEAARAVEQAAAEGSPATDQQINILRTLVLRTADALASLQIHQ
jgi:two-component system sensor histidine kinase/response regulator